MIKSLDVAYGLAYLHENDIIHGDLKGVGFRAPPLTTILIISQANILVHNSGRALLADFGLSAVTDPQILKWTSQSSAASKGGTTRWQAPELFDMDTDETVNNSKASDVYALGCVLYEVRFLRPISLKLRCPTHSRFLPATFPSKSFALIVR